MICPRLHSQCEEVQDLRQIPLATPPLAASSLSLLGWADEGSRMDHEEHPGLGPILILPLVSRVSLGSFLHLSEPQNPHL